MQGGTHSERNTITLHLVKGLSEEPNNSSAAAEVRPSGGRSRASGWNARSTRLLQAHESTCRRDAAPEAPAPVLIIFQCHNVHS